MRAPDSKSKKFVRCAIAAGLLIGASGLAAAQTDTTHKAMKSHKSMSSGHMMQHGTKHDSMMKQNATKGDATKHDAMKSNAMGSFH